jgi:hypothetical protein
VARRMPTVVGVEYVHGSVRSGKLWATTCTGPLNYGVGIDVRTKRHCVCLTNFIWL